MKSPSFFGWVLSFACLACAIGAPASAAELELQGSRLVVSGMLDGSAIKSFTDQLGTGTVHTVVFGTRSVARPKRPAPMPMPFA